MVRELPGAIVFIAFLAGFVFLMNHIADPTFNGDANFYTYVAVAIIAFATLMTYWEHIFPPSNRNA